MKGRELFWDEKGTVGQIRAGRANTHTTPHHTPEINPYLSSLQQAALKRGRHCCVGGGGGGRDERDGGSTIIVNRRTI